MKLALTLSGSRLDIVRNAYINEIYQGLVYMNASEGMDRIAFFSDLSLSFTRSRYEFAWTNLGSNIPAELVLLTASGQPVSRFPVPADQHYFLGLMDGNQILPLEFISGQLRFTTRPINLQTTVRVDVPDNQSLKANDVLTRSYLRVGEDHLVDLLRNQIVCEKLFLSPFTSSTLESLNIPITQDVSVYGDRYKYTSKQTMLIAPRIINVPNPNASFVLIGSSCVPSCAGKMCFEDNGCGQICGCPPSLSGTSRVMAGVRQQICNPRTGGCDDPIPTPLCDANSPCGGICSGFCPPGFECVRDLNGLARCVRSPLSVGTIILIIVIIILVIILIWALACGLNELLPTRPERIYIE